MMPIVHRARRSRRPNPLPYPDAVSLHAASRFALTANNVAKWDPQARWYSAPARSIGSRHVSPSHEHPDSRHGSPLVEQTFVYAFSMSAQLVRNVCRGCRARSAANACFGKRPSVASRINVSAVSTGLVIMPSETATPVPDVEGQKPGGLGHPDRVRRWREGLFTHWWEMLPIGRWRRGFSIRRGWTLRPRRRARQ